MWKKQISKYHKICNSSAIQARFGCFTAFFAANAAKNLAYGRTPYSKYTKIFRMQINLHSKFVYFDMAELLLKYQ